MIPTTIFLANLMIFLLLPRTEIKNHVNYPGIEKSNSLSMSVELHIGSPSLNKSMKQKAQASVNVKKINKDLELAPENFTEAPLQMEAWMNDPESWNTREYKTN